MEVSSSGCILSSLFFEQLNSLGDSEGLLLGEIVSRTTNVVSDSQAENIRHERQIVIQGFVPCSSSFSFYDRAGRINEESISQLRREYKEAVVGWYKFRRNTQTVVSLRERVIHQNLLNYLKISRPQDFLIGVFSSSVLTSRSTHSHEYSFFIFQPNKRIFEAVHVNIVNLGPTAQNEYNTGTRSSGSTSDAFEGVLAMFRSQFMDNSDCILQVSTTRSMYENMVIKLKELANEVRHSETDTLALAREVQSLREILEVKKQMIDIEDKNRIAPGKESLEEVDNKISGVKSPSAMDCDPCSSTQTENLPAHAHNQDKQKPDGKQQTTSKQSMDCDEDEEETQDVEFLSDGGENAEEETSTDSPVY